MLPVLHFQSERLQSVSFSTICSFWRQKNSQPRLRQSGKLSFPLSSRSLPAGDYDFY